MEIEPKNGNNSVFYDYYFECTLQLKTVVFRREHPKLDQNPWFINQS